MFLSFTLRGSFSKNNLPVGRIRFGPSKYLSVLCAADYCQTITQAAALPLTLCLLQVDEQAKNLAVLRPLAGPLERQRLDVSSAEDCVQPGPHRTCSTRPTLEEILLFAPHPLLIALLSSC